MNKNEIKDKPKLHKKGKIANLIRSNIPMFLIVSIGLLIILLVALYYIFMHFAPVYVIEKSGYAVKDKLIYQGLQTSNFSSAEKRVSLLEISEEDTLYKKINSYYIGGNSKKAINLNYPIYLEDSAMLNLSKEMNLITNSFEEVGGYPNFTIIDGKMYNEKDLTRADSNEYIFLKNKENLFVNIKEIYIKTSTNEYKIPINSIINFNKEFVSYYKLQDKDNLEYSVIQDIDLSSIITINNESDNYENILKKLKIIQEEKKQDVIVNEIEEPVKNETPKNEITENKEEEKTDDEEKKYIAPEVKCTDFTANVYTAKTNLYISDPSGTIQKAVEFTIYKDGKVYQRAQTLVGGNILISGLMPDSKYSITGEYTYKKESGEKVIKTFYEGTFNTNRLETLETINLEFENGEIFPTKIEIKDLKINNDLYNDEVLYGISKIVLDTGKSKYNLRASQIKELLNGNKITYQTDQNITSNSNIKYKFHIYDKFENELSVSNSEGETITSKRAPTLVLNAKSQNITEVNVGIKVNNKDNVIIENYKYAIYDGEGKEVESQNLKSLPSEIKIRDLDPNKFYVIKIFGDYDLENNQGKTYNVELGEAKFTTLPISSLGYVYIDDNLKDIKSNQTTISIKINTEKTDTRLVEILSQFNIKIKSNKDNKDTQDYNLSNEDLLKIKQGNEFEYIFQNLNSNTKYSIEVETRAKQGASTEKVGVNFEITDFITLKESASVQIKNQFVTGEIIDFDAKIVDKDEAVLNNSVRMELRDEMDKLLSIEDMKTNEEYKRETFNKLSSGKTYKILFYADEYNEGSKDDTYKSNYLLKKIQVVTEEGISGNLRLSELNKKENGKNLIDMASEVKWYVYPNFDTGDWYGKEYNEVTETLSIGGHGNSRRCVYDLTDYSGQTVTMSFKAKRITKNSSTLYIQNARTDKNRTIVSDINETEWKSYSYTIKLDESGYLGFYVQGGDGVQIKELQVELGSKQTPYQKYKYNMRTRLQVNLIDKRNEIESNEYFIKEYKNNELIETKNFQEIDESNIVKDVIKEFWVDEEGEYKFQLVIKIRNREYILDTQEIKTEKGKEIKGIYQYSDFKLIQPNGNYTVFCDLDFTVESKQSCSFGYTWDERFSFNGSIDFNGHKIIKDAYGNNRSWPIFPRIGKNGYLKNIVMDVSLRNNVEVREFYGLFYVNSGTIENLEVNLLESTKYGNIQTHLIGLTNYGTINKFVINSKVPYYGNCRVTLGLYNNYGTIKNGYLYGSPIDVFGDIPEEIGYRYAAGLVLQSYGSGQISNVYSLINVNVEDQTTTGRENVSNIVEHNYAHIDNIYSVGTGNTIEMSHGPSVAYNNGKINNNYYFADKVFNNSYNNKTTKLALLDEQFQNQILNSEDAFNIDDLISRGYYPQVVMPDCMPRQEYINLPKVDDADLPDIISTNIIQQGSDTVKVRFSINNPSGEKIQNISVQNLQVRIESQNYADGKSEVIATLLEPTKYVSTYNVLSITTKGAFNIPYTRKYASNERIINVDLYRQINSISDWNNISNHTDENFMLLTDLDFKNEGSSISITKTYYGKLEGQGHTIKNIKSNRGLLATFTGQINNLFIENYYNESASTDYTGVIEYLNGGIVNNVHIKGLEIDVNQKRIGGTITCGGLVGYTNSGSVIKNSSIVDATIISNAKLDNARFGGLVGLSDQLVIDNCFAQNVDISANKSIYYEGVGGLIGRGTPCYITNCYSTGKIFSDGDRCGGIIGNSNTSGTLTNCYSLVNVDSYGEYIGGIIGYNLTPTSCLSIGNIYTRQDTKNISRTSGYQISKKINYAYENQLINGYINENELDSNVLSRDEIFKKSNYLSELKWDDNYNYDGLSNYILPKLYYTDKKELLPNQEDNTISIDREIKVEEVQAEKTDVNTVGVRVVVNNPGNKQIKNVIIDDMNSIISKSIFDNGKTYIDLVTTPKRYYDSYKISSIVYDDNGEEKSKETENRIDVKFYKEIYNYNDWQSIEKDTFQNYKLMNDIDFEGKSEVNYNVTMARFEAVGDNKTLKNITLAEIEQQSGLINKISINLENINFENINITSTKSGNAVGIIRKASGNVTNINFKDITITAKKVSYVGCFAVVDSVTKDVGLEHITCYGIHYVGGYAGSVSNLGKNINGNNITIISTGNYVGGIVGLNGNGIEPNHYNINISNSNVTGYDVVGGLAGQSPNIMGAKATFVTVNGHSNVGGMYGYIYDSWDGYSNIVTDSNIAGSGSNIGGLAGQSTDWWGGIRTVKNSTVTGKNSGSNNVGGIFGYSTGACNAMNTIDVTVTTLGSNVGGIIGNWNRSNSTSGYWSTDNVTLTGYSNVGGLVGYHKAGRINYAYSNAKVTATGYAAGGISGYLANTGMTAITNDTAIVQVYVAKSTVIAPINAGGIFGKVETDFYMPVSLYTKIFVEANVKSNYDTTSSMIVGSDKTMNSQLSKIYIYQYSKINENYITKYNDNIEANNFLNESNLKLAKTYSSTLGFNTGVFNTNMLSSNIYPTIKYGRDGNTMEQRGISLPMDPVDVVINLEEIQTMDLKEDEYPLMVASNFLINLNTENDQKVNNLPTYSAYPISVNEFNIDFSKIDENAFFECYVNGRSAVKQYIKNKTYTFKYDFKTNIEINIGKDDVVKTLTIIPSDINKRTSLKGESIAYINENKLYVNNEEKSEQSVNLYDSQALTNNGKIYNILTGEYTNSNEKTNTTSIDEESQNNNVQNTLALEETKALEKYQYDGNNIESFGTYSIVNGNRKSQIYIVKNNKLSVIDSSLDIKISNQVIDFYNGKEYQSVLKKDGKINNLKESLKYPKNFNNSTIKEITMNQEEERKEVMVLYENGKVIVFNYMDGNEKYNNNVKEEVSLLDFLKENLFNANMIYEDLSEEYEQCKQVQEKLEETPISELNINSSSNNSSSNATSSGSNNNKTNKYTTMYNATSKKYEVYNENELLTSKEEVPESETTKIEKTELLSKYYLSGIKEKSNSNKNNGTVWIISTIIGILIILIILYKVNNRKRIAIKKNTNKK